MLARIFGASVGNETLLHSYATGSSADAVVTFKAQPGRSIAIVKVLWSYSATPTSGNLVVAATGLSNPPNVDITASGPGALQFGACIAPAGKDVTVTLANGAVVGKLYVEAVYTSPASGG